MIPTTTVELRPLAAVLILILSLGLLPAASRAAELPRTPAGQRMQEILDLISNGDSETISKYVEDGYAPGFRNAFPIAQHLGVFRQIQSGFPDLEPCSITESGDHALKVLLESKPAGAWLEMKIEVEPEPPYRIASLGIMPAKAPAGAGEAPGQEPDVSSLEDLAAYLARAEEAGEFSGGVLVAEDGTQIFREAYGLADKNHNVPNTLDTKFNLGSINKIFTSVAAAQLMEQGKLGLDDPIGKYLDGFPEEVADKVTIRHLLQMSSGWGDYWDNETFLANRFDLRKVGDHLGFIREMPLQFEPGSQVIHSNTGYEVLGAVIERVSGQDYYDYVRDHIYAPAGMTNTDSYDRDAVVDKMAVGYTNMHPYDDVGEGFMRTNTLMLPPKGTPAGGGYSTAGDMLAFAAALNNNLLLGPEYTALLFNGFDAVPQGEKGRRSIGIAGGAPGVSAFLSMGLDSDRVVVVLSNYDSPAAIDVGRIIRGMPAD